MKTNRLLELLLYTLKFLFNEGPLRKMAKLQIISSTTIILVSIASIAIVVNLVPEFKYTDNIFSLMEFNVFWIVLTLMGGLGLIFLIDPNIYYGFKIKGCMEWVNGKSKIFGSMLRVLVSMMAVLMVLSPAFGGIIFSTIMTNSTSTTTSETTSTLLTDETGRIISTRS